MKGIRSASAGIATAAPALLAGGPFAVLGAIGSLLQSDVSVAGIAYAPKSRIVAGMVAQRLGVAALTPGTLSSPADTAVSTRLHDLDNAEQRASAGAAKCGAIPESARSPGQKALIAEYGATGTALAALRTRLFTAAASGRAPILDVLLARKLLTHRVLRVRVEDAGGSVITTKNILTTFGAPALSVTGGVVAGYVLSAPDTGAIAASGLYRCQSQARMLHSVHSNGGARTACFRADADPGRRPG